MCGCRTLLFAFLICGIIFSLMIGQYNIYVTDKGVLGAFCIINLIFLVFCWPEFLTWRKEEAAKRAKATSGTSK